jgi:cell shape-determining protein MreC
MSRTSIIALLIFGAILGYFLSFGPEKTRKFQASVYQLFAPFLSSGSGIKKQITSVRSGLKSLDELERENATLRVDNRQLRATNQALRDVEREVNRLRHALNYRERSFFRRWSSRASPRPGGAPSRSIAVKKTGSKEICRS